MYGILEFRNGKYVLNTYSNVTTLDAFARLIVRNAMKEEGCTDEVSYLNGWVESLNECRDGEGEEYTMADVSTQASDTLVYSNAHYYKGRNPLTSEESSKLCVEVEKYLDDLITKFNL